MLVRIVRLELVPDKVERFVEIFHETKPYILNFKGCQNVELYRDHQLSNVCYTHSTWDSADHLNAYRNSDYFGRTWSSVKLLFSGKPRAYSLIPYK